jgi:hypothetical protein
MRHPGLGVAALNIAVDITRPWKAQDVDAAHPGAHRERHRQPQFKGCRVEHRVQFIARPAPVSLGRTTRPAQFRHRCRVVLDQPAHPGPGKQQAQHGDDVIGEMAPACVKGCLAHLEHIIGIDVDELVAIQRLQIIEDLLIISAGALGQLAKFRAPSVGANQAAQCPRLRRRWRQVVKPCDLGEERRTPQRRPQAPPARPMIGVKLAAAAIDFNAANFDLH